MNVFVPLTTIDDFCLNNSQLCQCHLRPTQLNIKYFDLLVSLDFFYSFRDIFEGSQGTNPNIFGIYLLPTPKSTAVNVARVKVQTYELKRR